MLDLPCSFLILNKALRGLSLSGSVLAFSSSSLQEELEAPETPPSLPLALFSSWLLLKQIIFLESPSLSSTEHLELPPSLQLFLVLIIGINTSQILWSSWLILADHC